MKKLVLALTTLSLVLVACGPSATPTETQPPDPTATSAPADVAEDVAEPTAEPTEEQIPPTATPEPEPADLPNAAPGVLLLHMYGHTRADWDELARLLQDVGIASLAIDLRGHGETGGAENWLLAPQDVAAALNWLGARDDVDAERLGAVGGSIGANLTMVLGSSEPDVDVIGLLSPGFDYFRVEIGGLMPLYGDRPALLAASEEDGYSADTVRALAAQAAGPVELLVYNNAGHATNMFAAEPGLIGAIVDFLVLYLLD
jgi:pimeloyl-ACP methyl ester carboxylesterase